METLVFTDGVTDKAPPPTVKVGGYGSVPPSNVHECSSTVGMISNTASAEVSMVLLAAINDNLITDSWE